MNWQQNLQALAQLAGDSALVEDPDFLALMPATILTAQNRIIRDLDLLSTEGDFSPTDTPTGVYMHRGDWVDFNLTDSVTTNAYTTASGSYSILTNIPVSVAGSVVQPVVNGPWANVTVGAGSVPGGATITTSRSLVPYLLTTGSAAKTLLGTTNLPASTSGISFTFSGHYRVR